MSKNFRKVTYFAKKRGTPCAARHSGFTPEKSRKLELVVDTEKRLVYTVIRLKLESFRKVCYFAKEIEAKNRIKGLAKSCGCHCKGGISLPSGGSFEGTG
jgi:hypothetical protein